MSFFRRGRSNKNISKQSSSDVNLHPDKHPVGSSLSAGATRNLEDNLHKLTQELAETRLQVAKEELRLYREQLAMRTSEHQVRMELLNLQLEALQSMSASTKGNNPTTVVGYFQV